MGPSQGIRRRPLAALGFSKGLSRNGPHAGSNGRVPQVFFTSFVQDESSGAVRRGVRGPIVSPTRCDLVGVKASRTPQVFGYVARSPLADPTGLLVCSRGVDLRSPPSRIRLQQRTGSHQVSRVGLAQQAQVFACGSAGDRRVARRRMVRPLCRVFLEHGAALPLHVLRQLPGPSGGQSAVRNGRRFAQLLVDRTAYVRRGLAQQPSPFSGIDPPGVLLVGDRHHVLRHKAVFFCRIGVGRSETTGSGGIWRAAARQSGDRQGRQAAGGELFHRADRGPSPRGVGKHRPIRRTGQIGARGPCTYR